MSAVADTMSSPCATDLSCPGCQMKDTAVLSCGHRLCPACQELCQRELGPPGCTVCYGRDVLDGVVSGLLDALFREQPRRRAQTGSELGQWALCTRHGGELVLFCVEDKEPVCASCQTDDHELHECCSAEEAVQDCKRLLNAALKPLQEKLEALNVAKKACDQSAEFIKSQARDTERVIKQEFEKLHQFLREEEAAFVAELKEEEEEKSQKMKEKLDNIASDVASLSDTIKAMEDELGNNNTSLLQNFRRTLERAQCSVQDPERETDELIDVARHLGCLKYRVWEKMQGVVHYTPVTLDPNTADICLLVSDDLTSVRYVDEELHLPDNPERFIDYECVLGSEGFTSGRHSWDVEVGDNTEWVLGVAKETIQRKEWFPLGPDRGLWSICLQGDEYRALSPTAMPLVVKKKPQRIRVQLDWDRGRVTFSDAADNALIHKFKHRFTEEVFPYFASSCKRHPLRVLPGRVSVTPE